MRCWLICGRRVGEDRFAGQWRVLTALRFAREYSVSYCFKLDLRQVLTPALRAEVIPFFIAHVARRALGILSTAAFAGQDSWRGW
jgi:hypothetical protein